MKKTGISTVIVFLLLVWGQTPLAGLEGNPANQPASIYDRYMNAVVVIRSKGGEGTGFFINLKGHIVTNQHVVGKNRVVQIEQRNGATRSGVVVKTYRGFDLALVKVEGKAPAYLRMAGKREGGVGTEVIAIGTALGLSWSLSRDVVSGIRDFKGVRLVQTDAAVNSGNSGGPLISLDTGRVLGVNTMGVKKHIAEGINFAVSASDVRRALGSYLPRKAAVSEKEAASQSNLRKVFGKYLSESNKKTK